MLTYQIASIKAPRKIGSISSTLDFMSKEEILKRNLDKIWFMVGDRVKFKKPRRPGVYGNVVEIVTDIDKVTWSKGHLIPMNIVVEVDKIDKANGTIFGKDRVKTNIKKLVWAANGKGSA